MTAAITTASSRRHPFRRAIAAFAVAAAVVPTAVLTTAGPSAAQGAPTFTVAPKVDLDPAGDTVQVDGTGYNDSEGVYVRFCSAPTGDVGTAAGRPAADDCDGQGAWITNEMTVPGTTPMTGGSWSVDLDAVASIGDADCTVAKSCGVFTRRDHYGPNDFSYDAFTPVVFAAPVGLGVPAYTAEPTAGLDRAGDTIVVNGTDYPDDVGVYVRFCTAPTGDVGTPEGRRGADDCNGQGTWATNSMAVPGTTTITDGAWTVELAAIASIGSVDCTVANSCGVAIRGDHNDPNNFSYDSFTPVTFAAAPGEGPAYTVTPTTGLDAAGDAVQVDGSKYPAGQGFYVRLCAAPVGTVGTAAARPGADDCDGQGIWVTNQFAVPGTTPNNNGSWNLELPVAGAFASDSRVVNCVTAESCGIFVRRDTSGAGDYSLDSFTALTFDPATTPPVIEPPAEPSLNTVELSLSKNTGLADGETITASGRKYTPNDGIYAQYCAKPGGQLGTAAGRALQCYPGQDGIHTVWFTPIPADGTFSTPIKVEKSFETADGSVVDCSEDNACGVFTRRDHSGSGDYSQDAFVGVSFGEGTAPDAEVATLSADRTSGLTPEGDTIAVEGANFRPGIDYVVTLCVVDDPAACDFANASEVTSGGGARSAGEAGSFAVDLDVQAAFGSTDCLAAGTECAVSTFAVSLSEAADEVEHPVTFAARSNIGTPGDTQGIGSPGGSGVLPRTGSNTIPLVAGGFMAMLLGAALVLGSRRTGTA